MLVIPITFSHALLVKSQMMLCERRSSVNSIFTIFLQGRGRIQPPMNLGQDFVSPLQRTVVVRLTTDAGKQIGAKSRKNTQETCARDTTRKCVPR